MPGDKKVEVLDLQGLPSGGDSWTRTNDPIDVNDVLCTPGKIYEMGSIKDHAESQYILAFLASLFMGNI